MSDAHKLVNESEWTWLPILCCSACMVFHMFTPKHVGSHIRVETQIINHLEITSNSSLLSGLNWSRTDRYAAI